MNNVHLVTIAGPGIDPAIPHVVSTHFSEDELLALESFISQMRVSAPPTATTAGALHRLMVLIQQWQRSP